MQNIEQGTEFKEYIQSWSQLASLEHKVQHAKKVLEHVARHYEPHEVAVAWTGGKDSTILLSLWREVLASVHPEAKVLAINLDTGHKFPEIVAFRDELAATWSLHMHIARPDWAILCAELKLDSPEKYPVAQNHVQCCRDLKITPLEKAISVLGIKVLLTGIRADEHAERAKRGMLEICQTRQQDNLPNNSLTLDTAQSASQHARIHAILAFTEMDVWSYTMGHNIPYCSLYMKGYRSLGCVPCTQLVTCGMTGEGGHPDQSLGKGERAGRNQEKEAAMQNLHELGYF